jgi:hypothetical protein
MAKFKIYGDYGYTSETLLEEFEYYSEAVGWIDDYVESGDMGGYSVIEVATFAEDGEYVVKYRLDADDCEWFAYEGDDDFALEEDF